jgi:hypothetical protein
MKPDSRNIVGQRPGRRMALVVAVVGIFVASSVPAGAAVLQGVYKGQGSESSEGRSLGYIKFRVTNDDKVTDVVLDDYKTRCDGKTYTISRTEFVNDPRIKGDGLGHFNFTYTFYKGTSNEMYFKVRGEFKRPKDPRAVGIVRVGGRAVGSPGDWCGQPQEWKATRTG